MPTNIEDSRRKKFWAAAHEMLKKYESLSGLNIMITTKEEVLSNVKFDGMIALAAASLQKIFPDNGWVYRSTLVNTLNNIGYRSPQTLNRKISETTMAAHWRLLPQSHGMSAKLKPIYAVEGDDGTLLEGETYVTLTAPEVNVLLETLDSTAVKLYLIIKYRHQLYLKNGSRNAAFRMFTITGDNGLAKKLGYATTNARSVDKALQKLEDHGLIAYTGNLTHPGNRGKYILINALIGDNRKNNPWVGKDLPIDTAEVETVAKDFLSMAAVANDNVQSSVWKFKDFTDNTSLVASIGGKTEDNVAEDKFGIEKVAEPKAQDQEKQNIPTPQAEVVEDRHQDKTTEKDDYPKTIKIDEDREINFPRFTTKMLEVTNITEQQQQQFYELMLGQKFKDAVIAAPQFFKEINNDEMTEVAIDELRSLDDKDWQMADALRQYHRYLKIRRAVEEN